MSGVSREVEFQLLSNRLSEMADNIELAEEQIWQLYAEYVGMSWDGEINYPDSFSIRDTNNELDQLLKVYEKVEVPEIKQAVAHEITELMELNLTEYPGSPDDYAHELQEELDEAAKEQAEKAAEITAAQMGLN